ncbi:MAG TPA: hypothetical protein VIV11_08385 [Kofleriaceae bacterium]
MTTKLVTLLISAALAAACTGRAHYSGRATVYATSTPDMVYVSPGVHVIADYDEPIFYANGAYWYNADGVWYRSAYYTGGWEYVTRPPTVIARIDRPHAYVRYRPHNYVVRNRPVPVNRIERPVVRDHRGRAARRGGGYYRTR